MGSVVTQEKAEFLIRLYDEKGYTVKDAADAAGVNLMNANWHIREKAKTYSAAEEHRRELERKKVIGKDISDLMTRGLDLGKVNQSWLAKRLGISRQAVSQYRKFGWCPKSLYRTKIPDVLIEALEERLCAMSMVQMVLLESQALAEYPTKLQISDLSPFPIAYFLTR